jgi:hypothetical protein
MIPVHWPYHIWTLQTRRALQYSLGLGWYSGTIDGETGLFPVSYTKPYVKKVYKAPTKMSSAIQKLQKQVSALINLILYW